MITAYGNETGNENDDDFKEEIAINASSG